MGTTAIIKIKEEGKTLVTLYDTCDGDMDGKIIKDFCDGKTLVTDKGISIGSPAEEINGIGDLAVRLIIEIKRKYGDGSLNKAGGVYIDFPEDSDSFSPSYTYIVSVIDDCAFLETIYKGESTDEALDLISVKLINLGD